MSKIEPAETPEAPMVEAGSIAFTSSDKVHSLLLVLGERIAADPTAGKLRFLISIVRKSGYLKEIEEQLLANPDQLDVLLWILAGVALELRSDGILVGELGELQADGRRWVSVIFNAEAGS